MCNLKTCTSYRDFLGSCFTLVLETTIKFYGVFDRDDSTNLTIKINFGKILNNCVNVITCTCKK